MLMACLEIWNLVRPLSHGPRVGDSCSQGWDKLVVKVQDVHSDH